MELQECLWIRNFAEKSRFKLEKLERPLKVTNVDGSNNSGENITHEVRCNIYYKGHQKRMCFDVCNLGCHEPPWTGLLASGVGGCHRLMAAGVCSDTSGKV